MPTDFGNMASQLRAEHEAKAAAEKEKRDAETGSRSNAVDIAVNLLKTTVLPVLERAQAEITKEGIESRITMNFDVKNHLHAKPTITFQCFGPARKTDRFQFKAAAAFFSSDGTDILVGMGKEGYDSMPKLAEESVRPDQAETMISNAVRSALESYFRELKKHKDQGTL